MTIDQMRTHITEKYKGDGWANRVKRMSDRQVCAIYYRMLEDEKKKEQQAMFRDPANARGRALPARANRAEPPSSAWRAAG